MAKRVSKGDKKEINIAAIGAESGRIPPQAIDVEEIVLGALLIEPNSIAESLGELKPECFYKETHRKIFIAISSLASKQEPVDIFTVSEELKRTGDLEFVGGPYFLAQLSSRIGSATHLDYHIKILLQKNIQRELISISYEIQRDSFDDSVPVDDLLDTAQQKLFDISDRNVKKETKHIKSILDIATHDIHEQQKREDNLSGVPSCYVGIDKVTLGWQQSDLIIIAARPSVGKTAFVLTMARNMAVEANIPVAFFSLEMSSVQLVKRLIVSETGLSSEKIRGGKKLEQYELEQLKDRLIKLSNAPLYVDETPSLSIYEFRSKARKLVTGSNVKLIIIDYLQLMTGPPELRAMREQEVSNISRSLKAIAKELNVPIVALSQLSRAVETRGGAKRPQLSDLRESGAIEQDADLVLFIHRPDYYGLEDETMRGLAEIIIAKHRNGEVCDVKMRFRREEAKFVDANDMDNMMVDLMNSQQQYTASKMNQPDDTMYSNNTSEFENNVDF